MRLDLPYLKSHDGWQWLATFDAEIHIYGIVQQEAKPRCSEAPRSATRTTSTWAIGYVDVNRNIFASEASHLEQVTMLIHVAFVHGLLMLWGYSSFVGAEAPPLHKHESSCSELFCLSDQIPRNLCRRSLKHQGIPRCNDTLGNFSSICGFFLHQLTQPWRLEGSIAELNELKILKKNEMLRTPELSELLHFMPWLRLSAVSAILEGRLVGPLDRFSILWSRERGDVKRCDEGHRVHPAFSSVCINTLLEQVPQELQLQTSISFAFERTPCSA